MNQEYLTLLKEALNASPEELAEIGKLDVIKQFKKGEFLVKEGAMAQYSFMVLKGCLRAYYLRDGEEKTVDFFIENDAHTPVSLVEGKPSQLFIEFIEDSELSLSTPEMETEIFKKFPRFQKVCMEYSEAELAKKQVAFDLFRNSTPEERYKQLLENKPELFQRVPQHQIASYLGIKPESLSRIRKRIIEKER